MKARTMRPLVLILLALSLAIPATAQSTEFTDEDAIKIMETLREGLHAHRSDILLSAFDREHMQDYSVFADSINSTFATNESFRIYYKLQQVATDNAGRGIALVNVQLEAKPIGGGNAVRTSDQLRITVERHGKGNGKVDWKIVDFSPRRFFS